jgi:hypothetical protein
MRSLVDAAARGTDRSSGEQVTRNKGRVRNAESTVLDRCQVRLCAAGGDRTARFNPTAAIQSRPKPGEQNPDGCVTSNVRSRLIRLTSECFQPLELVFIPGDAESRALRADSGAVRDL